MNMFKKFILRIRYPKLLLLMLPLLIGYLIYTDDNNFHFHAFLEKTGYLGDFLAGMFFVYGFTAGPAAAVLLISAKMHNFIMTAIFATAGSIIGNIVVFRALKFSVENELEDLSQRQLFIWLKDKIKKQTPLFVRKYIFPALAGFISAMPLPDEFAVALVAWSKNISLPVFTFFALVFNLFGIFILLLIGWLL